MKIQNGTERYFHSIYRCPSFKRLSHRSEFNSEDGECFHCSRWTVIERNRENDHLDLLTPRTRTWIDEMKEVSNVFQFHFNCCLKWKETIKPRSVLRSKENTECGVNMVTLDQKWTRFHHSGVGCTSQQQFGRNDKAGVTLQPWRIQNMFQCLNNSSESILD